MRYDGVVFRPPSEANSLLIQATVGCPHNKCTFCGMYKHKRFRIRKVTDINQDLESGYKIYGPGVKSIFFPDGNSIIIKTAQLIEILNYARQLFPDLERITVYGAAKYVMLKSVVELVALRQAGLSRIHSGMETGDEIILKNIQKGCTPDEIIQAGLRVKQAGIELSQYILVGIGGTARWREHAIESAGVLNAFDPDFIRLRTYVPVKQAPLWSEYAAGRFILPGPHQALAEIRLMIEHLNVTSHIVSDHVSNYCNISGKLPEDKAELLAELDAAGNIPEDHFRPALISNL
ncbi:MAG: radical SAM protein [Deltaproteobacteria bacterium]|nr:radical SAM protein [Deltaproteobacteria bacterium]